MYSTATGNTCDQTLNNNVVGNARMYVAGNLCIGNNAGTALSALIVNGNLDLSNNANVGASTSMATRVETYVGGNCRYGGGTWAACTGNQDARHIYSKLPNGTTIGVTHTPPVIAAPTADFAKLVRERDSRPRAALYDDDAARLPLSTGTTPPGTTASG